MLSRSPAIAVTPRAADQPRVDVEIVLGQQLGDMQDDWADLLTRAAEPNAFVHPELIRAAASAYSDAPPHVLLAWCTQEGRRRLAGIWAFVVGPAHKAAMPLRVLRAPAFAHGYLATPVVDRSELEDVLDGMLDAIALAPDLPNIIALEAMGTNGPIMAALERVLANRGSAPCIFIQTSRPKLESQLDGKQYLEQAFSSSSRKKLRQHRRRLSEQGTLTSRVIADPDALQGAVREFLSLEAGGWKGRQGTALQCNEHDASFVLAAAAVLPRTGAMAMHGLYLDGRPISMQLVLGAGPAAFTWKTAYAEEFRDFSPGILLLEDYTAEFLEDDSIAFVDSCAFDEHSFMSAWTERQDVADMWIDARPGGSSTFRMLSKLETFYRELRAAAKQHYLKIRQKR